MIRTFTVAVAALALAGCLAAPNEDAQATDFVRVSDAAAFSAAVVDRRLEFSGDTDVWFRLNGNGSMDGELRKGTVAGSWTFEGGYWCREFEAGGNASPRDCQLVELAGNQVRLTRDRGAGDPGVFLIR